MLRRIHSNLSTDTLATVLVHGNEYELYEAKLKTSCLFQHFYHLGAFVGVRIISIRVQHSVRSTRNIVVTCIAFGYASVVTIAVISNRVVGCVGHCIYHNYPDTSHLDMRLRLSFSSTNFIRLTQLKWFHYKVCSMQVCWNCFLYMDGKTLLFGVTKHVQKNCYGKSYRVTKNTWKSLNYKKMSENFNWNCDNNITQFRSMKT